MYESNNVIRQFEDTIAKHCGAPYGIAIESCSAALFLSCLYCKVDLVTIPMETYNGVPCAIINAGGKVRFVDGVWKGYYKLEPYPIIDSACRFRKNMYVPGYFHCLSFQYSKHLPIGRGGMILTDDKNAADWFRRMRNDGRDEVSKYEDKIDLVGYNMYMTPEQAARGLSLYYWRFFGKKDPPDLDMDYMDLSYINAYRKE